MRVGSSVCSAPRLPLNSASARLPTPFPPGTWSPAKRILEIVEPADHVLAGFATTSPAQAGKPNYDLLLPPCD